MTSDLLLALRSCRRSLLAAALFSMAVNLLMLVPPLYMLQLYDRVLTSRSVDTLAMITLIAVGLLAVMGALEWCRSEVLVRVGTRLDLLLNQRLFGAVFDRSLRRNDNASGRALNDLTVVRQFITGNGFFAFLDLPWVPIYLAILFYFHPWFGVFALASGLLLGAIAVAGELATGKLLAGANSEAASAHRFVDANLRNVEVLEAMGMVDGVRGRWLHHHTNMLALQGVASDRAAAATALSKSFRVMLQSLILALGGYLAIEQQITPGLLIAASVILGRMLSPIDQMIGGWRGFAGARTAYHRLDRLLRETPPRRRTMTLPAPQGRLSVEQAVVVPPGSNVPVVKGVSFTLAPGEVLGIIGPSASGKSSLLRALLGVWPTRSGTVRLDGAEVFGWNRDELGPHVGYLPQDIELLDGTVSQNIARFGEIDPQRVVEAARMAGVHEMILRLPAGYDTRVGVAGGVLSGGQRQRLGLARALYGEPRLVVLDEPNSNLDEEGDAALERAIAGLREQGTTVIVVSHRLRGIGAADNILVLLDGVARAYGPPRQILVDAAASS
ncbi:type I secretion system permease/ATPase [Endothiovibrio diazotrophicus]